jgi:hypothetical protein
MTLDLLDHAFLDRWNTLAAATASPANTGADAVFEPTPDASAMPLVPEPHASVLPTEIVTWAAAHGDGVRRPMMGPPPATDFIGRLLDAAWNEWSALADEIESARGRGRRAIAFVACERSVGCSTLVEAVVRILRDRGRDAISRDGSGLSMDVPTGDRGPTHDKRIVLVDAGVWFPPGRIHRQRLAAASIGCDAAILVRRPGREAPASWGVVLEAIGVEPLGEVVSFATSPIDDGGKP